jgi:hypothetical protein
MAPTLKNGWSRRHRWDINPIAVFLASDDSAWLTGETLLATGGIR